MVVRPSAEDAKAARHVLAASNPPERRAWTRGTDAAVLASAASDGGSDNTDQEVWTAVYNRRNASVFELPVGYNYRSHVPMSNAQRCRVYILHIWSAKHLRADEARAWQAHACALAGLKRRQRASTTTSSS